MTTSKAPLGTRMSASPAPVTPISKPTSSRIRLKETRHEVAERIYRSEQAREQRRLDRIDRANGVDVDGASGGGGWEGMPTRNGEASLRTGEQRQRQRQRRREEVSASPRRGDGSEAQQARRAQRRESAGAEGGAGAGTSQQPIEISDGEDGAEQASAAGHEDGHGVEDGDEDTDDDVEIVERGEGPFRPKRARRTDNSSSASQPRPHQHSGHVGSSRATATMNGHRHTHGHTDTTYGPGHGHEFWPPPVEIRRRRFHSHRHDWRDFARPMMAFDQFNLDFERSFPFSASDIRGDFIPLFPPHMAVDPFAHTPHTHRARRAEEEVSIRASDPAPVIGDMSESEYASFIRSGFWRAAELRDAAAREARYAAYRHQEAAADAQREALRREENRQRRRLEADLRARAREAEERARKAAEEQVRGKEEGKRAERRRYGVRWAALWEIELGEGTDMVEMELGWGDVPWPVYAGAIRPERGVEGWMTSEAVGEFLGDIARDAASAASASSSASGAKGSDRPGPGAGPGAGGSDTTDREFKKALFQAVRFIHPDKFNARIIPRVREAERDKVREMAEVCVRVVNGLIAGRGR